MNFQRLPILALACLCATLSPGLPAIAAETRVQPLTECRLDRGARMPTVKARCTKLAVPENPESVDGAEIELSLAVVPSLNIKPLADPLVLISGGPGQSVIDFYLGYRYAFEPIRRNRDIILVDQRGTGESNALRCEAINSMVESGENTQALIAATKACLTELPGDPRYYTTSVAVADLERVRRFLGVDTWNLYGISYGTRVAQHYLRRYPKSTRRVILDGVVHPELILGPGIAIDAQATLDRIFARCEEDEACGTRFPSLRKAFDELYQRLDEQPQTVGISDPTTGELREQFLSELELGAAVRLMSYAPDTVALLPIMIDSAWRDNNYAPLAGQVRMHETLMTDAMSIGMHNAVVCSEDAPFYEGLDIDRDALQASYLSGVNFDALKTMCEHWPRGLIDEDFKEPLTSDVPVLLLSGSNDPVTPPKYAEIAALGFSSQQHLIGPRQGHGLAARGCVPRLMAKFIEAETDPLPLDAQCVDKLTATPFFVTYSGPGN